MICMTCGHTLFAQTADKNTVDEYRNESVNEALKKSNIQSMSVAVVSEAEVVYLGNGTADALYQIGSMTKAFTALGVLYLQKQGKLNTSDDIDDYLKDFKAVYLGEPAEISIDQLLHQTSGYTNSEKLYPSAINNMSLEEWTRSISGKELQSLPGDQYAYSNVNHNLLGRIIEVVSGQSYEEYMEQNILKPLGLLHTFCGKPDDYGAVNEGTRQGFLMNYPYEIDIAKGQIPAGYIYSNVEDMARWINIQNGMITVPKDLLDIIEEVSKEAACSYYAGWEAMEDGSIAHSGGTPNYSSRIIYNKNKQTGVCVLANMNAAATVDSLCNSLQNGSNSCIHYDVWRIIDFVFTGFSALTLLLVVLMLLIQKKHRVLHIVFSVIITILAITALFIFPLIFSTPLFTILHTWAPYSMSVGIILLIVLACMAWVAVYKNARKCNPDV